MTRRLVLSTLVAVVLVGLGLGLAGPAGAQDDDDRGAAVPEDRRTVIISVPGLTWEDVNDEEVPNLRALLDESAVANLSLRVQRLATPAGEGYATLGAGTRAVAPSDLGGLAFGGNETFGIGTATDELSRQLGRPAVGDVLHLGWHELERENDDSEFEAELGTLGSALRDAGIDRGVIANADGDDLLVAEFRHREAALALADGDGIVPCGHVGADLLVQDPAAPFGRRLQPELVLETFRRCATPSSVVLVEASDLRRADAYGARVPSSRDSAVRRAALAATDRLIAEIIADLDVERDAVVVVAPSVAGPPRLAVLGIRAAEYEAGLLVSGSTRQDGHVVMADLTPTIAALAGAPIDEGALEGRPVEVGSTGGSAADRREQLEDVDAAARFRDRMITPVAGLYIASVSLLAIAAFVVLWRTRRSPVLEQVALCLLAVTPMTYLAKPFPFHEWGPAPYLAFVAGGALVLGLAYRWVGRRSLLHPLALAYAVVMLVIVANVVVLDSGLQLNTVFGDSPIVAGRFNGVNNVMFAQLFIGTVALAAIFTDRLPLARSRVAVAVLLSAVVLVTAAPMWGADVGGTLAALPALALVGVRLTEWRPPWRTVLLWGGVAAAAVVGLAVLDLSRDSADQSHLGRLLERFSSEGFDGIWTVIERKIAINLRSLRGSVWRFILVPVLVAAVVAAWRAPGRLRELAAGFPALPAIVPGLIVGLVLGYALNDSGIAVPGMMLAVSAPAVVYLVSRVSSEPASSEPAASAADPATEPASS